MQNLVLEIQKDRLAELPIAEFPGRTILIDNPLDCKKAIKYLMTCPRVGFDTETRPTFKKGVHHNVALLQVSTLDQCFLFRLNHIGVTDEIVALFESSDVMKIGLSVKDDLHQLLASRQFNPSNVVELQTYVKQFGIADNSLQKVYAIIFGQRISKGQRLTNWEADTLTDQQRTYAALDAYACLKMYNHLNEGRFHPEQSPYIATPDPQ